MTNWKHRLKADPTAWLLEAECAPVRYGTLVDILERSPGDAEVRAAQAAMADYAPVAELLAAQGPEGYWGQRDYYLPRTGLGTFWVLTVLGDLYWFVSLFGLRCTERTHWSRVACWGQPGFFKVALDLLSTMDPLGSAHLEDIHLWVRDKLESLKPQTPTYLLRYRRYRPWLRQSG